MRRFFQKQNRKRQEGFTLIEVCIALIIVGILMVPTIWTYNLYVQQMRVLETNRSLDVVRASMTRYFIRNGRYPRPADRLRSIDDLNFGQEMALAAITTDCATVTASLTVPTCFTPGVRDTTADADALNDPVFIGDVPFADLGIPYKYSMDAYGNKLTYAVSRYLTDVGTFNEDRGVIQVIGSNGLPSPNGTWGGTTNRVHYFLYSHGRDEKAAVPSGSGLLNGLCSAGAGLDIENCDFDSVFRDNAHNGELGVNIPVGDPIRNMALGANYFDDFVSFADRTTVDLWIPSTGTGDIMNNSFRFVRLGPDSTAMPPRARLDVNGNVQADRIEAQRICVRNPYNAANTAAMLANANVRGSQCGGGVQFSPRVIGGTPTAAGVVGQGIRCAATHGMVGIRSSDEFCSNHAGVPALNFTGTIPGCPVGQRATGVGPGGLICM